jgi:hypothetical protein
MSVIVYLAFVILVAVYASHRGRSAIGWGLIACIISPLIAAVILAIMKDLKVEQSIQQNSMDNDRMKERMAVSEATMNSRMDHIERRMDHIDGGSGVPVVEGDYHDVLPEGGSQEWKFCPNCGQKVEVAALFCPSCGQQLEQPQKENH